MLLGRKTKKRTGLVTTMLLVLVMCGLIFVQKERVQKQRKAYLEKYAELEQGIAEQKKRAEDIDKERAYVQTKKYIEEIARQKLGLIYKDEIILEPKK